MIKGFRDFILRGNVIDLAVAVIIGAAFATITKSLVEDIITPLIAAVIGKPDFSYLVLTIEKTPIKYGNFLKPSSTSSSSPLSSTSSSSFPCRNYSPASKAPKP